MWTLHKESVMLEQVLEEQFRMLFEWLVMLQNALGMWEEALAMLK